VTRFLALVALDLRRLRPGVAIGLAALAAGLVGFHRAAPALRAAGVVSSRALFGGYAPIALATSSAAAAATLLTAVLTAHLVAAERSSGVLAAVLVAPVSRRTWLLARAAAAVLRAAGVVALVAAAAWIAGALLFDLGDVRDSSGLRETAAVARDAVLLGTAHLVPPLVATASLALALGALARGPAIAVAAAVLGLLGAAFVGAASPHAGAWLFTSWLPLLGDRSAIQTAAGVAQGYADAYFEPAVLARGVAVSIGTAGLALGVAALGTMRERLAWREG
jgi:hypothetical protein